MNVICGQVWIGVKFSKLIEFLVPDNHDDVNVAISRHFCNLLLKSLESPVFVETQVGRFLVEFQFLITLNLKYPFTSNACFWHLISIFKL